MLLLNLSSYHCRWLAIAALIMLPLSLSAQSIKADARAPNPPPRVLSLAVGTNIMYDSNVFRLSPAIDPVTLLGTPTKSDQIIVTTAALTLNKNYSLQRFEATGSIVDNRYQNFDFLNFVGKNYTAAWHWRLTPYFHGTLSGSHREALNNFANLTGFVNSTTRNLRTDDNYRFEGIFEATRSWHLLGAVSHTTVKNSRLTVQDFDNKILSIDTGVRYILPSATSLTFRVRRGEGDFFKRPAPDPANLFDTRFHEMEYGLQLIWPVTIKTSVTGRVAHLDRNHDHFPQRDFAGFVGNIDFNWGVTSKTRLTA
ncbi:MAG: XrtB/PEP-CTERM-associated polysaccharide biosynthesis outer membrane protein EpsL, partial [Nitrosospira sp.]